MDMDYKFAQSQEDISKEQFALMIIDSFEEGEHIEEKHKLNRIAEKIADEFEKYKKKAVELLKSAEAMEDLLMRVDKKFKKIPKVGEKLSYIPELMLMVRSYITKEYTDISSIEIIAIIAALLYFVSPIDLIPDGIPGVGFLDDALVAGIVVKWCEEDLEKYMKWLVEKRNREE